MVDTTVSLAQPYEPNQGLQVTHARHELDAHQNGSKSQQHVP